MSNETESTEEVDETIESTEDTIKDTNAEVDTEKEEKTMIKAREKAQAKSKFILGNNLKPLIYKGKKVLKKYEEGKFTVIQTEDGATYKNIY